MALLAWFQEMTRKLSLKFLQRVISLHLCLNIIVIFYLLQVVMLQGLLFLTNLVR